MPTQNSLNISTKIVSGQTLSPLQNTVNSQHLFQETHTFAILSGANIVNLEKRFNVQIGNLLARIGLDTDANEPRQVCCMICAR